jgi:SAM-dependent methyltransferase
MNNTYPLIKDQDWISPVTFNLFKRFDYDGCGIDWKTARVLDVGCNIGNFISWSKNVVPRENYVGLDINEKFINISRIVNPGYQFVHCNKWHQSYNPTGATSLSIRNVLEGEFDVAIANSVFSHATIDQIRAEISDIFTVLKPGGILLSTFFTIDNLAPFLSYMKNFYGSDIEYSIPRAEKSVYLTNNETFEIDQDSSNMTACDTFASFYKEEKLSEFFTGAEIIKTSLPVMQTLVKFTKPV